MKQHVECPDEVESPNRLSAWTNIQQSLSLLHINIFSQLIPAFNGNYAAGYKWQTKIMHKMWKCALQLTT